MSVLSEVVAYAWEKHEGPIVLATVAPDGTPNVIYATCARRHGDDIYVVADNYMDKTRANIQQGCKGALLFITSERKAFQLKGTFTYETAGPHYDQMKGWLEPRHPGHAAVVLHVEHVYNGATQLL